MDDWDLYFGGGCLDDDDYDDDWNSGYGAAEDDGFYPNDDDVSDIFDPVFDNHFDDDERIIAPSGYGSDAIGDADAEFDLNQEPRGVNEDDEFDLNQDTNVVDDAEFDLDQEPHEADDDVDAEFNLSRDTHGVDDAEFNLDNPRGDGDFEYAIGGVEIHGGEVVVDVEDDVDEDDFFMTVRVRESSSSVDRARNGMDVFDTVFPARRRHGLGLFIDDDDDGVDRVMARDSPHRVRDSSSSVDREMNGTDVFDSVFPVHRRGGLLIDDDVDDNIDDVGGGEFASETMRLGTWSDDDYDYDDDVLPPGPRLFRVYADEWDGGMVRRRAVGDDVGEGVSGVAWEGEDGWGDAHWQGEEDVRVVTSSSRAEVTGAEDNAVVVSASGVECKGVEGVDSGIDGLSCPICMDPLSREGEHIACCLPCGHLYGMSCIKTWLQQRAMGKCPQCNKNCTFMDVRRLYLPQITVANDEMQEKIMILEAKCASLELKDAEWSKKEAEWNLKEAELRNQLSQQKEAGLDEIVG
ncbi:E3 ubiquitin-protein ligase rfwd3.S-like protein [Drosera capensis]